MGTAHHGDSDGGAESVTLTSVVGATGSWVAEAKDTHTIKVGSVTSSFAGVPADVVAGGAPIAFDAKVSNPTPSVYTNLSHLLFADKHATVQVLKSGTWTTLTPVADPREPGGRLGFYLDGRDSSVGADSSTVTRVRVSYQAGTPVGRTTLGDCVLVNEGSTPFTGTTLCQKDTALTVTKAAAATPTASATATPTPTTTASATATPATGAQLASTGAGSSSTVAAVAGGALLLAGAATTVSVRLRRRSH